MFHAHRSEGVGRRLARDTLRCPVEDEREGDVFEEREFRKQIIALKDEADPPSPDDRECVVVEDG